MSLTSLSQIFKVNQNFELHVDKQDDQKNILFNFKL
jgi:hypothetical protein